jgi:hypothetical protein
LPTLFLDPMLFFFSPSNLSLIRHSNTWYQNH